MRAHSALFLDGVGAKRYPHQTSCETAVLRHNTYCTVQLYLRATLLDGGNLTNALLSFQSIKTLLAALVHDLLHDIRYEPKAFTPKKMATGAREGLCVRCSASAGT